MVYDSVNLGGILIINNYTHDSEEEHFLRVFSVFIYRSVNLTINC